MASDKDDKHYKIVMSIIILASPILNEKLNYKYARRIIVVTPKIKKYLGIKYSINPFLCNNKFDVNNLILNCYYPFKCQRKSLFLEWVMLESP